MSVTRGYGVLESFLADRRAHRAMRLLPSGRRGERILDLGCGSFPHFLSKVGFRQRVGLDRGVTRSVPSEGLHVVDGDLESGRYLPFASESFEAVTMLAVLEHVDPGRVGWILDEIYRVLEPGGHLVLTTPASWTPPLLALFAKLRLVSPIEIDDHEAA